MFHYSGASLASAPLLQGRLNAGELGQTARLEEKEGDEWLGGWGGWMVLVGVWGLDEKQLPQDGGVCSVLFFFFSVAHTLQF